MYFSQCYAYASSGNFSPFLGRQPALFMRQLLSGDGFGHAGQTTSTTSGILWFAIFLI